MRPLIVALAFAAGVGAAAPPPITCSASVVMSDEPRIGGWPLIRLEFVNRGAAAVRVLNIWGSPAVWCPSSEVIVTRNGKPFSPGRVICDPPPPDEDWFVFLSPGEKKSFQFDPFGQTGTSLPSGTYSLQVSWTYGGGVTIVSAPVGFQVSR